MAQLFRLVVTPSGVVVAKDRIDTDDLTPAMRAPFIGPFLNAEEATVPLSDHRTAILTWQALSKSTVSGSLAIDDTVFSELVFVAGFDAEADQEALSATGEEWGEDAPDETLFKELAAIDQRPLLLVRQRQTGWPAELEGIDLILAAIHFDRNAPSH